MSDQIQFTSYTEENLPKLGIGVPAVTTDTHKVYVGSNQGNLELVNSEDLQKVAGLTSSRVNIYVDSIKGSGLNDGSAARPFKTLQQAVDSIPKVINYDRFIFVKDGTYNEEVVVKSISGAAIYFQRMDGTVNADTPTGIVVKSMTFYDISGLCRIDHFEFMGEPEKTSASIRFSRTQYGTVHRCRFARASSKPAVEFDGSRGSVNSSYFNGQSLCILSQNGSSVRVDSTNMHGNTPSSVAIRAQAAEVYRNGVTPWVDGANIGLEGVQGGQINRDVVPIDIELTNNWKSYNETNYKARAIKDNAGVVHLQGIIRDGRVGQGVIALTLPAGYRPKYNNHIFGCYSNDDTVSKVLLDVNGNMAVERNNGSYVSLVNIQFYAGW
ncbi:hypothetical protein RKD55_000454 [Rossellomorea marisflavi]